MENKIHRALQRVPPPPGFEERLLAAVRSKGPKTTLSKKYAWRLALAAGLVLAISIPYIHAHRKRRAEEAKAQLMLALRITSQKLNYVLERAMHEARVNSNPSPAEDTQ